MFRRSVSRSVIVASPVRNSIPGSDGTVTTVASTGYYTKETITPNAYASVRDITILRPLPFGVVPNVDAANADVTNCDATLIHHEDNASGWSRDWTRKLAGVQGPAAAVGEQDEFTRILAALNGNALDRLAHLHRGDRQNARC